MIVNPSIRYSSGEKVFMKLRNTEKSLAQRFFYHFIDHLSGFIFSFIIWGGIFFLFYFDSWEKRIVSILLLTGVIILITKLLDKFFLQEEE